MTTRRYAGIACIVFVAACAAFGIVYSIRQNRAAAQYFSNALRDAHVETNVSIQGTRYQVADGVVSTENGTTTGARALPVLKVAYAQAMARRSPVFGLSGVDPDVLQDAVQRMQASQNAVAALQASSTDAESMSSLYPMRFLQELSSLERMRQAFIASGSAEDADRYSAQLRDTVKAGKKDASAFHAEQARVFSARSLAMPGLGGRITTNAMLEGAAQVQVRMDEADAEISRRGRCTDGHYNVCDPADISVDVSLQQLDTTEENRAGNIELAKEIHLLITQSYPDMRSVPMYELSKSVCLSALPGPHYFIANPSYQSTSTPRLQYIGDIFFQTVDARLRASAPFFEYLASVRNISYMRVNPLAFYICPEIGSDLARVRALQAIAQFAGEHPSIAPDERALIVGRTLLKEPDELAYLRTALLETQQKKAWDEFNALINLSLMYTDRSSGLEHVVSEITRVNNIHVRNVKAGVPFDLSAWQLYLTHSAFPTLFLATNPSAGSAPVSVRKDNPVNLSLILQNYSTYSSLRSTVPRGTFVHDLRSAAELESGTAR